MGIISPDDLEGLAIFRQAASDFSASLADLSVDQRTRRIAKLLIQLMASDAIETSDRAVRDAGVTGVDDVRRADLRLIRISADLEPKIAELEAFLMRRVYRYYRVVRMTTKAKRFLRRIFEAYRTDPDMLPPEHRARADRDGLERAIADYVAAMTDRFAQDEYQRLYEPFERV